MSELDKINKHRKYVYIYNPPKTSLDQDNKCLPTMYLLPKLYKTPTKARYTITTPKYSVKSLSKAITSALKLHIIKLRVTATKFFLRC